MYHQLEGHLHFQFQQIPEIITFFSDDIQTRTKVVHNNVSQDFHQFLFIVRKEKKLFTKFKKGLYVIFNDLLGQTPYY